MSGGVDSSLAAALLHEAGHQVTGVTMHLWDEDATRLSESMCCSQEMTDSARRVAAQLGIPYYVFNYQKEFRRFVIDYFLREYSHGFTPNPCLECNREVKFRALMDRAAALGFDYVATGHYARIRRVAEGAADAWVTPEALDDADATSSFALLRASEPEKDQAYMLHMLGQAELSRLIFPLGGMPKAQVRALAAERGLHSADRPESQDICFVPGGDYRNLLRDEVPDALVAGPIVDGAGRELGRHSGMPLYTIGQRRGLGVAAGQPLYVTGFDPARNAVVVGGADELDRTSLTASNVTLVSGVWPAAPLRCEVQVRAHAAPMPATVTPLGEKRLAIALDRPQRAIAPGQAAVLYDGNIVLGGGRIDR